MRIIFLLITLHAIAFGAFDGISSFVANFTQKVYAEDGSVLEYQGRIYAKIPHHGLWIYEKPSAKEVYIFANEVLIYEPSLEQARISQLEDTMEFITLLKNAKAKDRGIYEANVFGQKYTIYSDKKGMPSKISFSDKLENRVEILFFDIKINTKIDDKIFRFTPKEGIDLIHQ